ncbi:LacI family DNA-binding transcriptional regulator [Parabacteroides sp. Marseille-P3160]|uniref:LacI family DNA-binding transcriptional regulator n=1 Tax=Parabacteroides sp. Marseille-P3160 TaxID=1917887 RepID=UPI0009BABB11|nr:LacI family DNA-binding transcriptional regulator [Parabacteroides sp. Marseille-P3160]
MERTELRKMLYRGCLKEVAIEAGVTTVSVSRFFKGEFDSIKIELAALKVAKKYNDQKKELEKGLWNYAK